MTTSTRIVVVGAGAGGAVVASRLSERAGLSVTLLEAGPDESSAEMPAALRAPSFVEALDVPGRTWPDLLAVRGHGEQPRRYLRGRGVGGSSAINALIALPGEPADYDAWQAEYGCVGWSWNDVAPWFDRTALTFSRAPLSDWGPLNLALAAAHRSASDGVALTRSATGERVSVSDAYVDPARQRANLRVRGDALVDRVRFRGRRAAGVVLVSGEEIAADVVVVSAGAIHSPAVLLRSGVDTDGVGDNLHDHPAFPVTFRLFDRSVPAAVPIATVARVSAGGPNLDLQIIAIDSIDACDPHGAQLMVALMSSRSRGTVRLASTDPNVDPVVDFNMLADEGDRALMERAIETMTKLIDHEAFRSIGAVVPFDRSLAAVNASLGDYVHAAGTCAMGRVVDAECRLRGYEGVIVCDASVMPAAPRANTHLPTVMIAERVAARLAARLGTEHGGF